MSTTHRYNTRFQAKKNAVIAATAPAVPPPIKLPEECPKVEFKTPSDTYQEIKRLINLANETPLKSVARFEIIIELFMFILANHSHIKYNTRLTTVARERAITMSNDIERYMKNNVWQNPNAMPNLCPQHMKEEAQKLVLYRVMLTLFNHVKTMCDKNLNECKLEPKCDNTYKEGKQPMPRFLDSDEEW